MSTIDPGGNSRGANPGRFRSNQPGTHTLAVRELDRYPTPRIAVESLLTPLHPRDQLLRERSYPFNVSASRTKVYPHVVAIGPTQARKRFRECRDASLRQEIVFVVRHKHAHPPYAVDLCARAASGHDVAAPPSAAMNSSHRRQMLI